MKRRNFISLMAVLAAAGALSACGSSSSAAGASSAAQHRRFGAKRPTVWKPPASAAP